jgi:hypothetical protein
MKREAERLNKKSMAELMKENDTLRESLAATNDEYKDQHAALSTNLKVFMFLRFCWACACGSIFPLTKCM